VDRISENGIIITVVLKRGSKEIQLPFSTFSRNLVEIRR
jgi:hypothetical protein